MRITTFVYCEERCRVCGQRLIQTPWVKGDYYTTYRGLVCQIMCNNPNCPEYGGMLPFIDDPNRNRLENISKTMKKRFGSRCATITNTGCIENKKIAFSIETSDPREFVNEFQNKTRYPSHVINTACQELGIYMF